MDPILSSTNATCESCQKQISRSNIAKHRRKCSTDRPAKRGGNRCLPGIDKKLHTTTFPLSHDHTKQNSHFHSDDSIMNHAYIKDCYVMLHRIRPSQYPVSLQCRRLHRRRAGFSLEETAFLHQTFNGQLRISHRFLKIRQLLKTDKDGLDILSKYTILQIRDKIKCMK